MIMFTNLNTSPMTASVPRWQQDVMDRVNAEFQEQAIETSEKIRQAFELLSDRIQPGYFASAFQKVLNEVPRYVYIKHITDPYGTEYTAQIDLAMHRVSFIEGE
jgi:hypothetical protein